MFRSCFKCMKCVEYLLVCDANHNHWRLEDAPGGGRPRKVPSSKRCYQCTKCGTVIESYKK